MHRLSWLGWSLVGILATSFSMDLALANPATLPVPRTVANTPDVKTNSKINANQVRKILDEIQAAAQQRDSATILKYLAPNAVINLTVQTAAGEQSMRLTRQQYAQYLRQGFDLIQDYRSDLSNVKVQVTLNGKTAYASYTLVEETTLKEPAIAISSSSTSTVRFDLIQDQLLATDLQSTSKVEMKQN